MALLDIFRRKWKHSNANVRLQAVKKLTDAKALAQVAVADPASAVRIEAIKLLNDQETLGRIVASDPDPNIRLEAVKRITDDQVLRQLAEADSDPRVRYFGQQKSLLRRLIWAISACSSFHELSAHTRTVIDPESHARDTEVDETHTLRAIHLSNDLYLLESGDLARSDSRSGRFERWYKYGIIKTDKITAEGAAWYVTILAGECADRLTDADLLSEIINLNVSADVRRRAIENRALIDQELLTRIAMGNDDMVVRLAAAEKLADQKLKQSVFSRFANTNLHVLHKLTDETLLAEVARTTRDWNICKASLEKLREHDSMCFRDGSLLQDVAEKALIEDGSHSLLRWVVENIEDQERLASIATCSRSMTARLTAIEKLSPERQGVFAKIAEMKDTPYLYNKQNQKVRSAALARITDETQLADVALTAHDTDVALEALHKLDNLKLVQEVAEKTWHIRQKAYDHLSRLRNRQRLRPK